MEKKILFLDFDGVLFDTLREVYLVNRFAYLNKSLFDAVDEENYRLFYKYKFLVYNIWMFYYYNPIIFNKTPEDNIIKEFNAALCHRNLQKEKEFCDNFLKIRADLVKNHYDFWKNLEAPYDFFFEIKQLKEEEKLEMAVVSKKNQASILKRFKSFDFDFDKDKVFAREVLDKYPAKGEFMKEYMLQNGFCGAVFVDDNENNLKTTQKYPEIVNILAKWGNTAPDSVGLNQKEAIEKIRAYFKSK